MDLTRYEMIINLISRNESNIDQYRSLEVNVRKPIEWSVLSEEEHRKIKITQVLTEFNMTHTEP